MNQLRRTLGTKINQIEIEATFFRIVFGILIFNKIRFLTNFRLDSNRSLEFSFFLFCPDNINQIIHAAQKSLF